MSVWGLDLSSTRDFSALCLAFPESGGSFYLLWHFWLPEAAANSYRTQIPVDAWLADPRANLHITDGDVIDYGAIVVKVRELSKGYRIA